MGGGVGRRGAPRRRRSQLRRMVVRAWMELVGESCEDQIEEGVSLLVARGGNGRGLGAGDGLTGANRGGGRGGTGRPESGKKGPSRLSQWLGGV